MSFFARLENSAAAEWLSLSMLGFPTLMGLHSVGMAATVGLSLIVTLHLYGVFAGLKARLIDRLLRIAIWGFVLNLTTGLAIFITRATDYLGSAMFLSKMLLVIVSATLLILLKRRLEAAASAREVPAADKVARSMSLISTITWFGAVFAGRLIAYLSDVYR